MLLNWSTPVVPSSSAAPRNMPLTPAVKMSQQLSSHWLISPAQCPPLFCFCKREMQPYGKQKEWLDVRLYLLTSFNSRITMWPSGKMGSLSTARQMWPLIETLCCPKPLKARADQEPTTCDHLASKVLHNVCVFFRLPNWTLLAK